MLRRAGACEIELQLTKYATPERLAQRGFAVNHALEASRSGEVMAIEMGSPPGRWKVGVQLPIGERQSKFAFLVGPDGYVALLAALWTG